MLIVHWMCIVELPAAAAAAAVVLPLRFVKLCREAGLFDADFSSTGADIIFTKVKTKVIRRGEEGRGSSKAGVGTPMPSRLLSHVPPNLQLFLSLWSLSFLQPLVGSLQQLLTPEQCRRAAAQKTVTWCMLVGWCCFVALQGAKKINYAQFMTALSLIASLKKVPPQDLVAAVLACRGPTVKSSVAALDLSKLHESRQT